MGRAAGRATLYGLGVAKKGRGPGPQPEPASDAGPALSRAVGDYLKAIWSQAGDGAAGTGDIARALGVTAPSVTGMLARLDAAGMVRYQPYKGAELTAEGKREAMRLLRRHRLLEAFMIGELGFGWDEVHDEAERLEHVVSDEFTERLAQHLGDPAFDPHGDPIPRRDGSLPRGPDTPLSEAAVGRGFVIHRVMSQDGDVLAYLRGLGIEPGRRLTILGREPGGRLLSVRVARKRGEGEAALSSSLAELVLGIVVDA